jgi:hypothetical protein
MSEYQRGFVHGFLAGVVLVVLWWIVIAAEVEDRKIEAGYLTRLDKVYTVKLFDTLDTPDSEGASK